MKLLFGVWCAVFLAAGAVENPFKFKPAMATRDIVEKECFGHLVMLKQLATDKLGVSRAFGELGFNKTVDYILTRTVRRYRTAFTTEVQEFTHRFDGTNTIWLWGPKARIKVNTLRYNTPTPLPDGIKASLVNTPVDDERGSACFEDQWRDVNVTGKIALVKRGKCAVADKLKLAKEHGALAVVLYNQDSGEIPRATLGVDNFGKLVPAGLISLHDGQMLIERLNRGKKCQMSLLVDSVIEDRKSWNIIAETKLGDPHEVIMIGAHMDSSPYGPGINDNASGIAALIELMISIQGYKTFHNKIRFAFWGSKESGMIGSLHYTSRLTEDEVDNIRFYFNYDMIGSLHPIWAVYAENEGDKSGARFLMEYLQEKEQKPAFYSKFSNTSDDVPFRKLEIPSSGLFTGAEKAHDPCNQESCDTTLNVNGKTLVTSAKAAAWAMASLAIDLDKLPARNKKKRAYNGTGTNGLEDFRRWARAAQLSEAYRAGGETFV